MISRMDCATLRATACTLCAYGFLFALAPGPAAQASSLQEPGTAQEADPARQAFAALQAGDAAAAVASFRAAIERNPKDIGAYVGLAQALLRTGKPAEAIAAHRKAVELNPLSPDLRIGLAATLEAAGKPEDAVVELRRAVTLSRGNPLALTNLAGALRRAGQLRAAERACLDALGYAPDAPAVHEEMAEILAAKGDWSAALGHYEAAVRLQPGSRPARVAHLGALNNAAKYADAERLATATLGAMPDDIDVRMALASALEGLEKRDLVIAEYRKVLDKAPTLAIAWGNLGWSEYGAGLLAEAEASSRKALELDSGLTYVRFNLGLILASAGRWDEAAVEYAAAVKIGDASDLRAALSDVEAALRRKPEDASLLKAKKFLENAAPTSAPRSSGISPTSRSAGVSPASRNAGVSPAPTSIADV